MAISKPWIRINWQLQSQHNFQQNLGQTAPSAWKCPKTQFWGPLTNWKLEPSPSPPTHSDPTINKHTEQVKKITYWFKFFSTRACGAQSLVLCVNQKRPLQPLFFGQVPRTSDEGHQLGQRQQTYWVESPTDELQLGRKSGYGRKWGSVCVFQAACLQLVIEISVYSLTHW